MHVTILGKRWNLRFVRPPKGYVAECNAPHDLGKEIRISRKLAGVERLDAIIHELLHAANWHLDEDFVNQCATDMAKVLWKLGYRLEEKRCE